MLTEQQLAARKNGIGGSDAAAVMGISKWETPYKVWQEKVFGPPANDKDKNARKFIGNLLEPVIAKLYTEATGTKIEKPENTFFHPKYNFIMGHLDGFNKSEQIILECKTTSYPNEWGEPGTCEMPDEYLCQVAHYAMLGLSPKRIDIPLLIMKPKIIEACITRDFGLITQDDIRIYTYHRNKKLENTITDKERAFWVDNVIPKIPPRPINSEDARSLYKASLEKDVVANDEIIEKVNSLKDVKSKIKSLQDEEEKLKTNIFNHMQDATKLVDAYGNLIATWGIQKRNDFETTKFKKENPELYRQYIKNNETRTFRMRG